VPNPSRILATVDRVSAFADGGPVSIAELRASGITDAQLRAAQASGRLLRLRRGIFIPTETWAGLDQRGRHDAAATAALAAYPGTFLSHDSAGLLHGLPTYTLKLDLAATIPAVHITREGLSKQDGWLRIHGCDTPRGHIESHQGLPVTDLVRTAIELGASRSLARTTVFIDAAMRIFISSHLPEADVRMAMNDPARRARARSAWSQALIPYAGHRWVTRLRRAVEISDPAAESVLESISRVHIVESGLPRPTCGAPVRGDDGRTYWVDMLWEEARLIGEADGLTKYARVADVVAEKRREEALRAQGWRFVRWGWAEGVTDPQILVNRVARALRNT
jgi:hypothetical protein